MILLQTILSFFVVLGTLIVVHELGHYWAARWCGVKILRFSVGFGKVLFSKRSGVDQTEWVISAIPLGGYVKMLDARDPEAGQLNTTDLQREFTKKSVWQRIAIVAAGPIANFLLAIAIYAGLNMHGVPEPVARIHSVAEKTAAYRAGLRGGELITAVNGDAVSSWADLHWKLAQLIVERKPVRLDVSNTGADHADVTSPKTVNLETDGLGARDLEGDFPGRLGLGLAQPATILKVQPFGAGARAGLQEGDFIVGVNGQPVLDGAAFRQIVRESPNKPLKIEILRKQQKLSLTAIPEQITDKDKLVGRLEVGMAGSEMTVIAYSPLSAFGKAVDRTWSTSVISLKMLGKMITGEVSWKNMAGPFTIADFAGQTARHGALSFFEFMALISTSLGIMNLLPIPVLDGGLLLYYSVEVLTGRPVSERFTEIAQRAGFGILMTLMVIAVFNDIVRLIA